ncbi:MAG TPA: 2-oxo-4-hydroxy-4-carboxy-5-ureidoimidazoline decarboxylase [Candidatus Limnocylindria bacterium]|jgi:2-oxo-4-hydroxy-4-carboxy--5-ureidoimidazoline (OHCU) decarboxylase|nr:2-oxo-4-hydroxy-4-carboxy-5-ureidoimidazoline decarboxylase [Candidatus Limnocylindria bacterium]
MGYPSIADLNTLSAEAFVDEVAPLFEGARGFLERLAAARPFESDHAFLVAARELARTMPEADQIELLNAHARLGADPASVSAASFEEQGYDTTQEQDEQSGGMLEELVMLNDVYEGRFGFRYVVFVAGRPLSAIGPLIEAAMRNDRAAELARGLDDVIDIAADRLGQLRGDYPDRDEGA